MSRNTLLLLQNLLHAQTIAVGADFTEIEGVLNARRELEEALAAAPESND